MILSSSLFTPSSFLYFNREKGFQVTTNFKCMHLKWANQCDTEICDEWWHAVRRNFKLLAGCLPEWSALLSFYSSLRSQIRRMLRLQPDPLQVYAQKLYAIAERREKSDVNIYFASFFEDFWVLHKMSESLTLRRLADVLSSCRSCTMRRTYARRGIWRICVAREPESKCV